MTTTKDRTLREIVNDSYENSKAHGFHDAPVTDETIPSKLALIAAEASEALESYRDPKSDDLVPVPKELIERLVAGASGTDIQELSDLYGKWQTKPVGFDIELADIIIRVADLSGALGIDLAAAVDRKHEYNKSRPYMHGRKV